MKNNQNGFTLVEVVVTIIVAGIMMIGLSSTVVGIRLVNARAKDAVLVNSIVEQKIEELRSQTFIRLVDGSYDFTADLPDTITSNRYAGYEVASIPGNPALKQVTVTVSYNDFNDEEVYTYRTFIGELGVGQY